MGVNGHDIHYHAHLRPFYAHLKGRGTMKSYKSVIYIQFLIKWRWIHPDWFINSIDMVGAYQLRRLSSESK